MNENSTPLIQSRLKDIFPHGFDSKSSNVSSTGAHYTLKPEQLCYSLVERYDPSTHVESIIVKTIWYGRHTKSGAQEFLLIHVEDTAVEGLTNYLILDRNTNDNRTRPSTRSQVSFAVTSAIDQFRVSYEGDLDKLLRECQLKPCKYSETLQISSDNPLYLYELVTLAAHVSDYYPNDHAVVSNHHCYPGYIWACLRTMRPSATWQNNLSVRRGKVEWACYTPNKSETEALVKDVQDKIEELKLEIDRQKIRWRKLRDIMPDEETSYGVSVGAKWEHIEPVSACL